MMSILRLFNFEQGSNKLRRRTPVASGILGTQHQVCQRCDSLRIVFREGQKGWQRPKSVVAALLGAGPLMKRAGVIGAVGETYAVWVSSGLQRVKTGAYS
jgi:hypothetical protein